MERGLVVALVLGVRWFVFFCVCVVCGVAWDWVGVGPVSCVTCWAGLVVGGDVGFIHVVFPVGYCAVFCPLGPLGCRASLIGVPVGEFFPCSFDKPRGGSRCSDCFHVFGTLFGQVMAVFDSERGEDDMARGAQA
jgi:hypothetical protein